jgi:polar amino acid transport system permease protein
MMMPTGAWDWAFAASIAPALLAATVYSVFATLLSFAGALLVGLPLAIARDTPRLPLRLATGALVEVVRSTPILIQVYFLYFVLPTIGIVLPALVVGVLALSLHYGTYVSEA